MGGADANAGAVVEGAFAPSTIRAHYYDVRSFVDWCGRRRLESFPARVETVCAFVEDQGGRLVPTTVRRRIGAIGKFHRLMSLPDTTRDEEVRISMRRIVRSRRLPPQQARGLSRDQLSKVLAVQPETGWGLRDRAILALDFEMLARRSEIVALRDGDLEWRADGTLRGNHPQEQDGPCRHVEVRVHVAADGARRGGVDRLAWRWL